MNTLTITITSKNQVTLPAKYVRRLNLTRNRVLSVTERKGALVLKPAPSIDNILRKHWDYAAKHMKRPLTDEELNNAARDAYANHKAEA